MCVWERERESERARERERESGREGGREHYNSQDIPAIVGRIPYAGWEILDVGFLKRHFSNFWIKHSVDHLLINSYSYTCIILDKKTVHSNNRVKANILFHCFFSPRSKCSLGSLLFLKDIDSYTCCMISFFVIVSDANLHLNRDI